MVFCHDNSLCLRRKTWKIRVVMLVTSLVKFTNKYCKTTELGLLLQALPVHTVTFVETLGSHLRPVTLFALLHMHHGKIYHEWLLAFSGLVHWLIAGTCDFCRITRANLITNVWNARHQGFDCWHNSCRAIWDAMIIHAIQWWWCTDHSMEHTWQFLLIAAA